MTAHIFSILFAALSILIAVIFTIAIPHQGGLQSRDEKRKRRVVFWILFVINPVFFYLLASTVLEPSSLSAKNKWNDALPLATSLGVVAYLLLGYILSKMFKNGKVGNWF